MSQRLKFKTKYQKILELLLYLAHRKPGTDHYAASKYVYLADRMHFNLYGRPITNDEFGAMPWGPVALRTYELLKEEKPAMRAANIDALPFETQRIEKNIYIVRPNRSVDYDVFSESDIEVFDRILEEYGKLTMLELHNETMKHYAYRTAWNSRPAGKKLVEIFYEDLLEEGPNKQDRVEDLLPIAHKV